MQPMAIVELNTTNLKAAQRQVNGATFDLRPATVDEEALPFFRGQSRSRHGPGPVPPL